MRELLQLLRQSVSNNNLNRQYLNLFTRARAELQRLVSQKEINYFVQKSLVPPQM